MFKNQFNFFYKTGFHISGTKSLYKLINNYNLVFFLGKRINSYIVKFNRFLYNFRISLFFLYRIISLRGKILAFDDRFYIRRCLIFFLNRANQNYIVKHWIGGTLTNFKNFKFFFFKVLKGLLSLKKYYELFSYFFGLKRMHQLPSLIILTNPNSSLVCIQESLRLNLPVLGLIDLTTENIFGITFPIPTNNQDTKIIIFFYLLLGDIFLYAWLRPLSFFFFKFLKRLRHYRKINFIKNINYSTYFNVFNMKLNKFVSKKSYSLTNLKILFPKSGFLFYYYLKNKFKLKFVFLMDNVKLKFNKKFNKKFFKKSFLFKWFLKNVFKLKTRKKPKKILKRLFKYNLTKKKKIKKKKFYYLKYNRYNNKYNFKNKFLDNKYFYKTVYKKRKALYIYMYKSYKFLKKVQKMKKKKLKKNLKYSSIIKYIMFKNYYKNIEIEKIIENYKYEEKHIEDILFEFNEIPEERKVKFLKQLNKNFFKLKSKFVENDKKITNSFNKLLFVKKFNFSFFKSIQIFSKGIKKLYEINYLKFLLDKKSTIKKKILTNKKLNKKNLRIKTINNKKLFNFVFLKLLND